MGYSQSAQPTALPFQIIYNQLFHFKKTPLTTLFGQYQYGKSRSREVLTATSHIGVRCSYNDVRRSLKLLAAYTVAKSDKDGVPVPSKDFSDRSSITGTESDHFTMQVLYLSAIKT